MKKFCALILSALLLFSLAFALISCGGDEGGNVEGGGENGGDNAEPTKYTYTVTVLAGDEGVSGAVVVFEKGTKKYEPVTTNADGVAALELEEDTEITAYLTTLPTAYSSYFTDKPIMTEYTLVDRALTLTVSKEVVEETYTIRLVDASGAPVANVLVQMCDSLSGICLVPVKTDADGVAVYTEPAGNHHWQAQVSGDVNNPKVDFDSNREATLVYTAK